MGTLLSFFLFLHLAKLKSSYHLISSLNYYPHFYYIRMVVYNLETSFLPCLIANEKYLTNISLISKLHVYYSKNKKTA